MARPLPVPPPLILRERPPIPPAFIASQTGSTSTRTNKLMNYFILFLVICRLPGIPVPPRSVIIERLPPLPPKPRKTIASSSFT